MLAQHLASGLVALAQQQGYALGSRSVITTTGASTYTPPAGCKLLLVECVGGGGGGQAINPGAAAGQIIASVGGGGGGYSAHLVPTGLASSYTATVGTGGSTSGLNGNVSTFAVMIGVQSVTLVSAQGGAGGLAAVSMSSGTTETFIQGPSGGNGTAIGSVVLSPRVGGYAHRASGTVGVSGAGGDGPLNNGAGGQSVVTHAVGNAGGAYGGGGGGAMSVNAGGSRNGGVGAQGVIVIWEFY